MRNAQNNLQIKFGNTYTGNFNLEIKGRKWIEIAITVPIKFSILGKSKLISQLTFKAMALGCSSGMGHSLLGASSLDPLVHIFSFGTHVSSQSLCTF